MAGQIPQFLTGAQATIKLVNGTGITFLAYCTDLSYNVSVQHIPVEALGQFEVYSNEPVSYSVNGSFSIIRYKVGAGQNVDGVGQTNVESDIDKQMTPSEMLTSQTFDLGVIANFAAGTPAGGGVAAVPESGIEMIKIKDCRITNRSQQLNKRNLMVDTFQFVAIGVDSSSVIELDVKPS